MKEPMTDSSTDINELLREAARRYDAMSAEEKEAMFRRQVEGVARAEASWPRAKFKWVNGVKVYDSYEDKCND